MSDREKELFEAWATTQQYDLEKVSYGPRAGDYLYPVAFYAYESWKARSDLDRLKNINPNGKRRWW